MISISYVHYSREVKCLSNNSQCLRRFFSSTSRLAPFSLLYLSAPFVLELEDVVPP